LGRHLADGKTYETEILFFRAAVLHICAAAIADFRGGEPHFASNARAMAALKFGRMTANV
jgi:hypothetical protein